MPPRIVITSFGSYGDVYPYIGLALRLRDRGMEPVLATSAFYQPLVEREGLSFHPVRPDVDPRDRTTVGRIMDPNRGTEFIVSGLILPSLAETYEDLNHAAEGADLLISHPITFAAPIVAERRGLPWVSTVLAPMSFFSAKDLPVFPPAPWAKRLERLPGAAEMMVRFAKNVTRPWGGPVRDLRARLGLPEGLNPIFEGQHSPHLVLGLFSRLLAEPQSDWPSATRVTGAIDYNGPPDERSLSPDLEAFLDAGPPPIVFTLGTSAVGAAGDFYQQSAEAVRLLGRRTVMLVGSHEDNRPTALPAGVRLESYASHAALFPRASVIVHQGGAGTLHQALRAGRPTLIVPFAHDQPDNAYRAEKLGTSRTLPSSRYRARRVARELERLLTDPSYHRNAADVGTVVRQEDGAAAACFLIEGLLYR
jgi:UDP:flavonoid glycosyltransferase YjiC (YdhE family)